MCLVGAVRFLGIVPILHDAGLDDLLHEAHLDSERLVSVICSLYIVEV